MIKPFPNYVLIKPDIAEKKTAGGIILPEETMDIPQTGTVIELPYTLEGVKVETEPEKGVKKGTKVWFNKWSEKGIIYNNQKYFAVHYKDLLAYEEK